MSLAACAPQGGGLRTGHVAQAPVPQLHTCSSVLKGLQTARAGTACQRAPAPPLTPPAARALAGSGGQTCWQVRVAASYCPPFATPGMPPMCRRPVAPLAADRSAACRAE